MDRHLGARMVFRVEIAPEDELNTDVSVIYAFGDEFRHLLQHHGYAFVSVYTGKLGGNNRRYQVAADSEQCDLQQKMQPDLFQQLNFLLCAAGSIVHILFQAGKRTVQPPGFLRVALTLGDIEVPVVPLDVEDDERIATLVTYILAKHQLQYLPEPQQIRILGKVISSRS
ncbi:hypothetical protein KDW_54810 [Dictyobacter vulcani]|uniref:Uncharacterized protein n=1 Tax=Dictyobacter vulcani TaxID=2607529 RepID=A0A5J4KYU6_9CHLR|nr:hypothetical protein [Dictyobacter vulcani]GER91319.1 hypothetical protein KDW_54810 [Dictyobacter vulcani]